MHRIPAVVGVVLAVLCSTARAEERGQNEAPEGFVSLFNGHGLNAWRGRQQDYSPYEEAKLSRDERAAKQEQSKPTCGTGKGDIHECHSFSS